MYRRGVWKLVSSTGCISHWARGLIYVNIVHLDRQAEGCTQRSAVYFTPLRAGARGRDSFHCAGGAHNCDGPPDPPPTPPPAPPPVPPPTPFVSSALASHMVLQRDVPARIWGGSVTAGAIVNVTVVGGAGAEAQTTKANSKGDWSVDLAPRPATVEPSNITVVSESNTAVLTDVLFGDVWGCHGRVSNISSAMSLGQTGRSTIVCSRCWHH